MSYIRSALLSFLLVGLAISTACALEISVVGRAEMKPFLPPGTSKTVEALSNHTVSMRSWETSDIIVEALPIANASILYFAPDGQVLAWSSKSDVVETGEWKIEPENERFNNLCLKFDNDPEASTCQALHFRRPIFYEITDGNPFGLSSENEVPYHIELEGAVISAISNKMGI